MILKNLSVATLIFFALPVLVSCTEKKSSESLAPTADPITNVVSSDKGKRIYQANCIACHNMDPKQKGAIGPEVWGASKALLEARVLHGTYPEGYQPKRTTRTMVPLPHLKNDIDSLQLYLNADVQ